MMNKGILYTSYFANWRKWKKLDNTFNIVVTRIKPKYIDFEKEGILHWDILSPKRDLLYAYKNDFITEDKFREKFIIELSENKECTKALNDIKNTLNNGINVNLICYEKTDDFCHRHILGEIFNEIGYKTKEI